VAEAGANQIDEILAPGYTAVKTVATGFAGPVALAVDRNGNLYVANASSAHAVEKLTAASNYSIRSTLSSSFTTPFGIAIDASGNVFVADKGATAITELVAVDGEVPAAPAVRTYGSFATPMSIAVDPAGNIYVADSGSGTITELTAADNYTTSLSLASGIGSAAGVAVDSKGNVYYSDSDASRNTVTELDLADVPALAFLSSAYQTLSSDSPKSVIISNIGAGAGSDISLSSLSVNTTTANAPNSFSQVAGVGTPADCSSTTALTSGGSCNVSVSFTPQYAELINGTVGFTYTSSSAAGSPAILLTGTGTKATPVLNWAAPASIVYGTDLTGVLNATAMNGTDSVAGTFAYSEQIGAGSPSAVTASTVLPPGTYTLTVHFTPADTANFDTPAAAQVTLIVNKATLTVSVNDASRAYGAANPTFSGTVSGLLPGDTVTTAYSTTATATSPVGNYPITATVTGADTANYTITTAPGTLSVTQAPLSVVVQDATRTYGAANPAFTGTITGLQNGDTVTTTYSTTAAAASVVGTYPITAAISGAAAGNYNLTVTAGKLAVTQAPLTIVVHDATRVYGAANPTFSGTITGLQNGDTVTAAYSTTATAASAVGTYPISAVVSGASATNYNPTITAGKLTVTQAPLSVAVHDATRVYGAANPAFTGTITGLQNGDTVTTAYSTTAIASSAVGSYPITATISGAVAGNYNPTVTAGKLTITQATLTVTAQDATRAFGAANPAFTAVIAGYVNGDGPSSLTGAPAFSTTATATSPAGTYPITPSVGTLAATNYSFSFVPGKLIVGQATPKITWPAPADITYGTALSSAQLNATSMVPGTLVYTPPAGTVLNAGSGQTLSVTLSPTDKSDYASTTATVSITVNVATPTIAFAVPNHTYTDAPFPVAATSNSTGAITYSVISGPATLSGSTVTLSGAGTVTLQASQAAAGNYGVGTQTTSFSVAPATATLQFAAIPDETYGNSAFSVRATSSSNGPVTYSVISGPATMDASTGLVTLTGAGTVTIGASQAATQGYAASAAQITIAVAKEASQLAVAASSASIDPNQPVTLTATVSPAVLGTPSGTVTFFSGTTQLADPVVLTDGIAKLVVFSLASGSDPISATYSGDANFLTSSSSLTGGITVAPLAFTMSASPSSQTGAPGTTFTYQLTVTPTFGAYPGSVTFSASGLPAGANATFSPSSIAANSGAQTVTVTVTTAKATAAVQSAFSGGRLLPAALALLFLPLFGTRRMRQQGRRFGYFLGLVLLAVAGVVTTVGITGCGSSVFMQQPSNQPQKYDITVTATSGAVQQASTVTLTLE
jgi:hypothetical protein